MFTIATKYFLSNAKTLQALSPSLYIQINNNIIPNGIQSIDFWFKTLSSPFLFDRAANTNQPYRLLQNRILLFWIVSNIYITFQYVYIMHTNISILNVRTDKWHQMFPLWVWISQLVHYNVSSHINHTTVTTKDVR